MHAFDYHAPTPARLTSADARSPLDLYEHELSRLRAASTEALAVGPSTTPLHVSVRVVPGL